MAKKSFKANLKRHAVMLGDSDRKNIDLIKERYGVYDTSAALRMAAKLIASATEIRLPPANQDRKVSQNKDDWEK